MVSQLSQFSAILFKITEFTTFLEFYDTLFKISAELNIQIIIYSDGTVKSIKKNLNKCPLVLSIYEKDNKFFCLYHKNYKTIHTNNCNLALDFDTPDSTKIDITIIDEIIKQALQSFNFSKTEIKNIENDLKSLKKVCDYEFAFEEVLEKYLKDSFLSISTCCRSETYKMILSCGCKLCSICIEKQNPKEKCFFCNKLLTTSDIHQILESNLQDLN